MGAEMKPVTVKLDDGAILKLGEIEDAFAPFTRGRSATVRLLIELVHALIFTKGTLQAVVGRLQGLLRRTSYFQMEFEFPTLAAPEGRKGPLALEDARRPRVALISRRSTCRRDAGMVLAYGTSSANLRPIFAGRQA